MTQIPKSKCVLETHPEFGGCCCICQWHLRDMCHPDIDGQTFGVQKGWICAGFAFCEMEPTATSGWWEHGMCELFKRRPIAQDLEAQGIIMVKG